MVDIQMTLEAVGYNLVYSFGLGFLSGTAFRFIRQLVEKALN